MKNSDYWIRKLKLVKHPEGGYFRETHRSHESVAGNALPKRFDGQRSFSTAIYFLLRGDQVSHLHRIKSDELWHFYDGSAMTIHMIDPHGQYKQIRLGRDLDNGEVFQAVVENGCWFGATVDISDAYSLVGCTVAPGFDFHDFEMADRYELIAMYPEHIEIIEKLTLA
ncbi:cupin domain-containing protein [Desulfonema magnum]|uniref:DUF985 n=1 Tax=Desulfonema magnum TaxID=45655 RepID=A0A975BYF6_9BACT|nr:cupin domain-containing protein [Desulfonema magnum]QTA93354.1 DUF985 [Desulfonema magnum]